MTPLRRAAMFAAFAASLSAGAASPAAAGSPSARDGEGEPVALIVRNDADAEIACHAALAHWRSAVLGRAAPGAALTVALLHDPRTGALGAPDGSGGVAPIEAIWCARTGRGRIDRARVPLRFAAGPAEPIARRCAPAGDGPLACREAEPD